MKGSGKILRPFAELRLAGPESRVQLLLEPDNYGYQAALDGVNRSLGGVVWVSGNCICVIGGVRKTKLCVALILPQQIILTMIFKRAQHIVVPSELQVCFSGRVIKHGCELLLEGFINLSPYVFGSGRPSGGVYICLLC